jgi:integrase/recombinase XerD
MAPSVLACTAASPGAPSVVFIRRRHAGPTWSCTSGGCRRSGTSSRPRVSRRFSVIAGFYRTAVIDGVLDHSPAEHVRRPTVPPGSPTLGFTHLQFEAMLTASRESAHPSDFALVAMLGPLGLRIFEATSANIADLGEEHGPASCGYAAREPRSCSSRSRQQSVVPSTAPSPAGPAGPILLNNRGTRIDRHAATRRLRHLAQVAGVHISRTIHG